MQNANYLKAAILGLLITISAACVYDPHYHGPAPHPRPTYYYPWGYYYYPSVRVYFQYSTGYYFYPKGNVWIRSRVLPLRFRLDPRDRVHLEIRSDKPYLYHSRQEQKYRPRPDYRPQPDRDRSERETLRHWYQQQQEYKKEKRFEEKPRDKGKEQRRR